MEGDRPPSTQENGRSSVQYAWVILFKYDINQSHPFSILPLSFFMDSDFPWESVEGFLSAEFRIQTRRFSCLGEDLYTIFAKVEVGKNFMKNVSSVNAVSVL